LLRTGVAAFGEEPEPGLSWQHVQEVVRLARECIESWLDDLTPDDLYDLTHVFEALDVLTLLDATLGAGLRPRNDCYTTSPFKGSMSVAARLLEEAVEVLPGEAEVVHG
jgi:hypothetical protein